MAIESVPRGRAFQLVGGHPALDLVNTLDWRFRPNGQVELLKTYADLVRFTEQTHLTGATGARRILRNSSQARQNRTLSAARELREALAELLYGAIDATRPKSDSLKTLETFFKKAHTHRSLQWSAEGATWIYANPDQPAELPLWRLSVSAEELITSNDLALLRACAKPDCRWLFLDTSKNHTRRWCDMKLCGNRMKARRFKAQHPFEH